MTEPMETTLAKTAGEQLREVEQELLELTTSGRAIPWDLRHLELRLLQATSPPEKKADFALRLQKLLDQREEGAGFSIEEVPKSVLKLKADMQERGIVFYHPRME